MTHFAGSSPASVGASVVAGGGPGGASTLTGLPEHPPSPFPVPLPVVTKTEKQMIRFSALKKNWLRSAMFPRRARQYWFLAGHRNRRANDHRRVP